MYKRALKSATLVFMSTGLVFFSVGCKKAPPIQLACNASAPAIYPGEPLTVTGTASSVSTKKNNKVIYSWSGEGVTGSENTAKVATESLQPGDYTVKGQVKEGKKDKEGLKPGQTADCSVNYKVKPFEPPTISCSASPTTIKPGGTATITAEAVSPQNRPLTYSYSASAGSISGTGTSAEFTSAGAPTGKVGITCKVSDDKDHTASANTSITILATPPPPPPHTQALCSISFSTDTRRPTRVDNEAKACLDQVALELKQQADAKLVIVGDSNAKEKETEAKQEARHARYRRVKVEHFAAQRAVNTKEYLVTEQGIDASRISVMTGTSDEQSAQNYLVPQGADFAKDVTGTTPVNETVVTPQVRKPLPMRHR